MTYAELIAEIKLLSKRGDIDDKIAIALRMTTLRAHRVDFFWRDHVEANVTFANSQIVTIPISSFTRFRQVNYIQYYDSASGLVGGMLSPVEPGHVIDEHGYFKTDAWYLSGTNIQANFRFPTTGARVGYWQNPDLSTATYNSWIATELPDILVQGSLAWILNATGNQEEARALNKMVGFEPDPDNRAPGFTLVDQLRAIGVLPAGSAY